MELVALRIFSFVDDTLQTSQGLCPLSRLKGTPATASYDTCPSIQGYLGKYPRELRQVPKDA